MSLASWLWRRRLHLPAPITRDIVAESLRIPMRDGSELLADRYYPRGTTQLPTILIRSCYGRDRTFRIIATLFAEQNMQVVLQSCRGTAGSQGTFRPYLDEKNDGADTIEWIGRQLWFSGKLGLWGQSYLGNTAWAIASVAASKGTPNVGAIGLHVTASNFRDTKFPFGGFHLISSAGFTLTMLRILRVNSLNIFSVMLGRRNKTLADRAASTLPLRQADRLLTPAGVPWWQDWMDHAEPGDPWWEAIDYSGAARTMPPTAMVTGWYDIFLPWQLHDFEAAQNANRDVRITIGPWTHSAVPGLAESVRRSIELFQEKLASGRAEPTGVGVKPRVRLFLMGANEWREYPSWPPPNTVNQIFYLHPSGAISGHAPVSESLSNFDYKPADPTPAFHGPMLDSRTGTGNMAELERRPDALVFTSEPFLSHLDVVGPVSAEIFFRSNTEHTDFYVCLCDVTRGGHSINVCDGYRRLRPDQPANQNAVIPTGTRKVNIEFWPTAYRFQSGHRMRIIVASGAHPRFARNPGSGEPLGDATTMVVAHQQIFHGPEHPSAITLAVMPSKP